MPEGTPIFRTIGATADAFNDVRVIAREPELARLRYVNGSFSGRAYRRAKLRLLHAVHQINRREVRELARTFDGMM